MVSPIQLEGDVQEVDDGRLELVIEPDGLEGLCKCTDGQCPPVSERLPIGQSPDDSAGETALELMVKGSELHSAPSLTFAGTPVSAKGCRCRWPPVSEMLPVGHGELAEMSVRSVISVGA